VCVPLHTCTPICVTSSSPRSLLSAMGVGEEMALVLLEQFSAYLEEQRAEMRTAFAYGRLVTFRYKDSRRQTLNNAGSSQTCMDILAHSVRGACSQVGMCVT
jgi:hypothetical protein